MIPSLVLACALRHAYCHPTPAVRDFTAAVDAEVPDERIRALLVVFADHESGIDENPIPRSHDARDLTSCGVLQMQCGFVRTHSLRDQVRGWLWRVQRGKYGLAGICGNGDEAKRIAYARAVEAERLIDAIRTGPAGT